MKITDPVLKADCHKAIDTLAQIIRKIPQLQDGTLEIEIARDFSNAIMTLNWLLEHKFTS